MPEIDAEKAAGLRRDLEKMARQAARDGDANTLNSVNKLLDNLDGVRRGPGYVSRTGPPRTELASAPDKCTAGLLREITRTDQAGRQIREFVGAIVGGEQMGPIAWMSAYMQPLRKCRLTNITNPETQGSFNRELAQAVARRQGGLA